MYDNGYSEEYIYFAVGSTVEISLLLFCQKEQTGYLLFHIKRKGQRKDEGGWNI